MSLILDEVAYHGAAVRDINAVALHALVEVARKSIPEAAMLFGCQQDVVSRLLALADYTDRHGERFLELLAASTAPMFRLELPHETFDQLRQGFDWRAGEPSSHEGLRHCNVMLWMSILKVCTSDANAAMAWAVPASMARAVRQTSSVQAQAMLQCARRALVRLELTVANLNQLICASGDLVEPLIGNLLLWGFVGSHECSALPPQRRSDDATPSATVARAGVGRPSNRNVDTAAISLAARLAKAGADKSCFEALFGAYSRHPAMQVAFAENRLSTASESRHAPPRRTRRYITWNTSSNTHLASTVLALMFQRMRDSRVSLAQAAVMAHSYYQHVIAVGSGANELVNVRVWCTQLVPALAYRRAFLRHCPVHDAASLVLEVDGCLVGDEPPHRFLQGLGKTGKPSAARSPRRRGTRPAPSPLVHEVEHSLAA